MRSVMVRYKVKQGRGEENAQLVRAVYDELASSQPDGLRYATFRLEDRVSFVHIASVEDGQNPLSEVKAFQEFLKDIAERCDEPPVTAELDQVGSFRFW